MSRPELKRYAALALLLAIAAAVAGEAKAQAESPAAAPQPLVNLDFVDADLSDVIDAIARLTRKNFVWDDRVRGKVTIVSPTPVSIDQAYTVFESVLQVKGFTTVEAPGGVIKVIPIADAKETSIDTRDRSFGTPRTDRFVTRLIPLSFIDADAIAGTLRPLVGKQGSLVAYGPTNTLILTDAAANIRRVLSILDAIDVEIYKEELALLRLEYADAGTLAQQLSEIFGADVSAAPQAAGRSRARRRAQTQAQATATPTSTRGKVRILTDERTNSLIVLAARATLRDIRSFVRKLDVPIEGGGRIQVHYLRHADAEELADTLNSLLSGQPSSPSGGGPGGGGQQVRSAVTELAGGVTSVTSDPATNALVIQASPEGFEALIQVIEKLDIPRPQVLVEALIMEVDVTDTEELGFNAVIRLFRGDTDWAFQTAASAFGIPLPGAVGGPGTQSIIGAISKDTSEGGTQNGTAIQAVIRAAANDNSINILSAPHILTSDNEEAEISVGDNIPIITSRVESASGISNPTGDLASSVNVERQDIGVTLRVTPQISEGDTLRLEIFQEITAINEGLNTGDPEEVGVALSNRRIENTVVVNDGDTIVVGGLVSDDYTYSVSKVPFLGDIPFLGWAFKSTNKVLMKRNLLIFLTPNIIRSREELEGESIRKREEFRRRSEEALGSAGEPRVDIPDEEISIFFGEGDNLNVNALAGLERRYPVERLRTLEERAREEEAQKAAQATVVGDTYSIVARVFAHADEAQELLLELVDAGYEGLLLSSDVDGRTLFEVRIGPYDDLRSVRRNADTLEGAYGLEPRIVVESPAPPGAEIEP